MDEEINDKSSSDIYPQFKPLSGHSEVLPPILLLLSETPSAGDHPMRG